MAVHRLPAWVYGAIALVPALILLFAADRLDTLSVIGLAIPAIFWSGYFSVVHWKRLDEPARAANTSAWKHGGVAGLLLALLLAPVVHFLPAAGDLLEKITDGSPRWPEGQLGFVLGVLFAAMMQMAGFTIAWARWWLKRR